MLEIVDDHLYTTREATRLLRVSHTTIRGWLLRGEIAAVRVGPRKVFFWGRDLKAVIVAYKAAV